MSNQKEHILITGGAGFIGSHLIERLLNQGEHVAIIDDLSTGQFSNIEPFAKHHNFRFVIDSVFHEEVFDGLVKNAHTVIHLAAAVGVRLIVEHPVHTIQTNVMGTERVLKAALRYKTKVLIASTSEVYGKENHIPFAEDDDIVLGSSKKSRWAYAASKLVDEFLGLAYYREYNLPVAIVRFFNTIGPRQTGHYGMVVPRFMVQAICNKPITVYGDGTQSRCFCDVRDVVSAITQLIAHPTAFGEVFNIGGNEEVTIKELAERVIKLTHSSSPIVFVPYEKAYTLGFEDMHRRVPDTSRIFNLSGWKAMFSLNDTLAYIQDYFRLSPETLEKEKAILDKF
ncbi:MAG: GDP-mannose 4,6-dehydratase [Candidatus Omnitrophica bacterium]|nr:GDP-mannose 4,6-dehydratase [Candidatus Omnitrophota bacterium]